MRNCARFKHSTNIFSLSLCHCLCLSLSQMTDRQTEIYLQKGRQIFKSQKTVSLLGLSEAMHTKSHQHDCLNIN